jgi:uroporphyrinogen decarboxylase
LVNSRERVLTTLAHREPDRVPISFAGIFDYPPYGYRALCAHLGITDYPEPINLNDDSGVVFNPDERLLARLHNDLRDVSGGSSYLPVELPDGSSVDEWGLVRHHVGAYWDLLESEAPLRDARNMDDVRRYDHWPSRTDPAISAGIREQALAFRDAGYPVLAVPSWAEDIFHNYAYTRGFSQWLMDMYEDPHFYHAYSEFILEMALEYLETFLPPIADAIDVVMMGEDLGSQLSPFMSPAMYRQFCKPYHARWCEEVRRLAPGKPIALHTCGNVYPLIPDFIEMGISILNPVQPLARMMEPWRLKREFGHDLTFHGGFDIQELLPHGTVQQIRDGAKALVDTYGPGGGFIFCPAHSIQAEVPPENVVAMYDAAIEFGRYPIGSKRT